MEDFLILWRLFEYLLYREIVNFYEKMTACNVVCRLQAVAFIKIFAIILKTAPNFLYLRQYVEYKWF